MDEVRSMVTVADSEGAKIKSRLIDLYSARRQAPAMDDELFERALTAGDRELEYSALLVAGTLALHRDDFARFDDLTHRAAGMVDQHPGIQHRGVPNAATLFHNLAIIAEARGELAAAWEMLAKALIASVEHGGVGVDTDTIIHNLALHEIYIGNRFRAARLIAYGGRILREPRMAAIFLQLHMALLRSEGLFDDALTVGLQAERLTSRPGLIASTVLNTRLFEAYLAKSAFDQAESQLEWLPAEKDVPARLKGLRSVLMAELALARGRIEDADQLVEQGGRDLDPVYGRLVRDRALLVKAKVSFERGELERSRRLVRQIDLDSTREPNSIGATELLLTIAQRQNDTETEMNMLWRQVRSRRPGPRRFKPMSDLQSAVDSAITELWTRRISTATEQRADLARVVVHDLNGLAATYEMALDLFDRGMTETALDAIVQGAASIAELSELLSIAASLDAGDLALNFEPIAISDVVRSVHRVLAPAARAKGQHLNLAVDQIDGLVEVTDSRLLTVVVSNLVTNAIKYTKPGGLIEIRAHIAGDEAAEDGRRWIEIDVVDNGPGLAEHEMTGIFDRYAKGDAVPTGGESSLGLGLYLVGALCQILGLTVQARSDGIGHGSVFSVLHPIGAH